MKFDMDFNEIKQVAEEAIDNKEESQSYHEIEMEYAQLKYEFSHENIKFQQYALEAYVNSKGDEDLYKSEIAIVSESFSEKAVNFFKRIWEIILKAFNSIKKFITDTAKSCKAKLEKVFKSVSKNKDFPPAKIDIGSLTLLTPDMEASDKIIAIDNIYKEVVGDAEFVLSTKGAESLEKGVYRLKIEDLTDKINELYEHKKNNTNNIIEIDFKTVDTFKKGIQEAFEKAAIIASEMTLRTEKVFDKYKKFMDDFYKKYPNAPSTIIKRSITELNNISETTGIPLKDLFCAHRIFMSSEKFMTVSNLTNKFFTDLFKDLNRFVNAIENLSKIMNEMKNE